MTTRLVFCPAVRESPAKNGHLPFTVSATAVTGGVGRRGLKEVMASATIGGG